MGWRGSYPPTLTFLPSLPFFCPTRLSNFHFCCTFSPRMAVQPQSRWRVQMINVVWFFFAAVFFYLGYAYWNNSKNTIRPFFIRRKPEPDKEPSESFMIMEEFVKEFNSYLETVNNNTKTQNLVSAGGFFFAGLATVIIWIVGYL